GPNDLLIRYTISNAGPEMHDCWVLPTFWFRNTWSWGRSGEGYVQPPPRLWGAGDSTIRAEHETLGVFELSWDASHDSPSNVLFTHNETNMDRLFKTANARSCVKDAFHDWLVHRKADAVSADGTGTKAALVYHFQIPPGESRTVKLRLRSEHDARVTPDGFGQSFDACF